MRLYAIKFLHGAPKSSAEGIKGYLLAKDDQEVFDWFASDPGGIYSGWDDLEDDALEEGEEKDKYWKSREMKRQEIIKHRGDFQNDDWADAYYGIHRYGWKDLGEVTKEEIAVLRKFKAILPNKKK